MIKKSITLEDCRKVNSDPGSAFKVLKMVNSTQFEVWDYVSTTEVNELCNDDGWTVTIVARM